MKYRHHNLEYEIDDEWLAEAGAVGFRPNRDSYSAMRVDGEILFIPIASVEPLTERARLKGIFCDDRETCATAKERVIRLLRWFVADEAVEPVKVVTSNNPGYKYKLVEGCHRFHCAHALGFVSVPATLRWSE